MEKLLLGQTAIITGGSSGIGKAIAERFAEEGANIVIAALGQSAINDTVNALTRKGGKAVGLNVDLTTKFSVESTVRTAIDVFGRLDIMVNNAGSTGDPSPILDITEEGFSKTMALDVNAVLLGHKYAAHQFIKQGTGGSIITTASVASLIGGWSSVSYSTAKHAVVGIVTHAAKELAPYGIRCNAIAPGVTMTPLIAYAFGVPQEKSEELVKYIEDRLAAKQALGRYSTVEDHANAALFLASEQAAYINGVFLPIDGGITCYTQHTSDPDIVAAVQDFLAQR